MISPDNILDTEVAEMSLVDLGLDDEISFHLSQKGYIRFGDVYALQAEGISLVLEIDYSIAQRFWTEALELIANPENWVSGVPRRTSESKDIEPILNLTEALQNWLKEFFVSVDRARDYTVLLKRFGLNGKDRVTLEELGVFLDLTRERIRQIQNNAIRRLRKYFFSDRQTFTADITHEISLLREIIEGDGSPVKLEDRLFQFITSRYGAALTPSLEQHYRLLFTIFGWEEVSQRSNDDFEFKPFWILDPNKLSRSRIIEVGNRVVNFLQFTCTKTEYFSIKVHLNSSRQKRFKDLEIRTAMKACPDIEQIEDDTFLLAFHRLKSAQDMAFRVLSDAGKGLSASEIHRRVSQLLALSGEKILSRGTISNSMANDKRFVPIGKSQWILKDWEDFTLGTIIENIKQFFYQHNKPANAKEIYEFVKKRRPVKRNSISTYLADRDEFVRVGRGLYQLSEWGSPKSPVNIGDESQVWTKERVVEAVIKVFDTAGTENMAANELVQELITMGLTANNIYAKLRNCPAVELTVVSDRPRRLNATVIRDYTFVRQPTLRDRLQEMVREVLSNQPENTMPLFDLRRQITKRANVHPATFYSYLSDMIDIQKNVVSGTRSVIVTLVKEDNLNIVADVWDSEFIYDIAISYAGAQRAYASDLAEEFRANKLKVFFDRNQLPDLVGRNLLDELLVIYRDSAKLCVILASEEYNKSMYAQYERQSAQERALSDDGYIVLVNLDGCKIHGFHSTVAYLDWNHYGLKQIASLAIEQLNRRVR